MLPLLCVLSLMGAPAPGENLEMRMQNGLWDVEAINAPLSSILDRLSHDTGMQIIHLSPPLSERVSAHLEKATLAEVVEQLLKRHAYAERLDQTSTQVEVLVLAGSAATTESGPAGVPPSKPVRAAQRLTASPADPAPATKASAVDESQESPPEPPRGDASPVIGTPSGSAGSNSPANFEAPLVSLPPRPPGNPSGAPASH